jgi:hypothetical protein
MSRHLDPPEDLIGGGFVEVALPGVFAPQQDPSGIGKRKGPAVRPAAHHRVAVQPGIARIKVEILGLGEHEVLARRQGEREPGVPELEDLEMQKCTGSVSNRHNAGLVVSSDASLHFLMVGARATAGCPRRATPTG